MRAARGTCGHVINKHAHRRILALCACAPKRAGRERHGTRTDRAAWEQRQERASVTAGREKWRRKERGRRGRDRDRDRQQTAGKRPGNARVLVHSVSAPEPALEPAPERSRRHTTTIASNNSLLRLPTPPGGAPQIVPGTLACPRETCLR